MASRRRKRRRGGGEASGKPVELNVMPFVDVFSLLTTFLLFSAVFIQIGIVEVQVPFFTNKPSSKDDEKSKRLISVNITVQKKVIEIETFYKEPPRSSDISKFQNDDSGIDKMHNKLVDIRTEHPDTDKVTLFVDDEVIYEKVIDIIDAIKLLSEDDPYVPQPGEKSGDSNTGTAQNRYLYPKVVMGNILL